MKKHILILLIVLTTTNANSFTVSPRSLRFVHHVIDSNPPGGDECCTDVLAVSDLNSDGKPEVVIGAEFGKGDLVWYEQVRPDEWSKHPIAEGNFTTDGAIYDLNGDGRPDIITAAPLSWFESPREPTRMPWKRHIIAEHGAHDIILADLDGDGEMEIVTVDKREGEVSWHDRGTDIAKPWRQHVIAHTQGEGLAVADVDRDSRLDVLIGRWWYQAPEEIKKRPWKQHVICSQFPEDTRIQWADINGDGIPEIVMTASEGPSRVSWFERPQNVLKEEWVEHIVDDQQLVGLHSLQLADLDGDGRLDIVTGEMHTSPQHRVLVYQQLDADAGQWRRYVVSEGGAHNARVADFNGDDHPDIAGKNYAGTKGEVRRVEYWETIVE